MDYLKEKVKSCKRVKIKDKVVDLMDDKIVDRIFVYTRKGKYWYSMGGSKMSIEDFYNFVKRAMQLGKFVEFSRR